MKRTQVNEILSFQTQRRRKVSILVSLIVVTFLFALSFLFIFITGNKLHYVKYNEKNNTSYKVFIKDNEFFNNDYLEKDNEYISSLIDKIEANFDYLISVEENISYNYSYKIESNVYIKRKNSSEYLYNKTDTILDKVNKTSDEKLVNISETVNIDYNAYNNLMKKFVNSYALDDIESILTVNMYVNVLGACDNIMDTVDKESVLSIKIPLTTRVVDIESSDNLLNNQNNLLECKKNIENTLVFLILFIGFLIVGLILLYVTVKYIVKTRTAENIYQREIKKILNNYGSYIQTLTNKFDFKNYQILHIKSFNDMLEISDTINQPILMKENNDKTGAYFLILANTKVIYIYRLKVSTIYEDMDLDND